MNNLSKGDFKSVHTCDYRAYYGECEGITCLDCRFSYSEKFNQQAAGINDKKFYTVKPEIGKCFCFAYDCYNCYIAIDGRRFLTFQAANTKPDYTPEQQEMIDYLNYYETVFQGEASFDISIVKRVYIDIINKYK